MMNNKRNALGRGLSAILRNPKTDITGGKSINAITYITQKKNTIRGNHFHKKTIQWNYILEGKIELFTKFHRLKIYRHFTILY